MLRILKSLFLMLSVLSVAVLLFSCGEEEGLPKFSAEDVLHVELHEEPYRATLRLANGPDSENVRRRFANWYASLDARLLTSHLDENIEGKSYLLTVELTDSRVLRFNYIDSEGDRDHLLFGARWYSIDGNIGSLADFDMLTASDISAGSYEPWTFIYHPHYGYWT